MAASANGMTRVFVGLGSNLGDPAGQVQSAVKCLGDLPDTRLIRSSSLYRSLPMGPSDQPSYINAVAEIATALEPQGLLEHLQQIELAHGRNRTDAVRWGPRTLDLDILVYGDIVMASPQLQIPHPGIAERAFVLYPLAEIEPLLRIPGLGDLNTLLQHCPPTGLSKMQACPVEAPRL